MSAKKPSGRANQQSNKALHSEARTKMVRWLDGALTPQEREEFDEQVQTDKPRNGHSFLTGGNRENGDKDLRGNQSWLQIA